MEFILNDGETLLNNLFLVAGLRWKDVLRVGILEKLNCCILAVDEALRWVVTFHVLTDAAP